MNTIALGMSAILVAATLALAGCNRSQDSAQHMDPAHGSDENTSLVKLSDEEAARAGVKTETLAEQQLAQSLSVTATVEVNRERTAHVLPRIPGRIVNVTAKLGDAVKRGQRLAVLESIEGGEASAAYEQALAEANIATAAYERAERLHAERIIPGKEYQRAKGEYDKTQAQLQAAASKLKMLGIAPSNATESTGRSHVPVNAPLDGTVVERKAVLGELAGTEEALFVIVDLSTVWVEANIMEEDLGRVRNGAGARVRIAGRSDGVFEGKVRHVASILDKETRTAKAIIELDNAKGLLRPLMFAHVAIETGANRSVLALAESSVTLVQGQPTVFIKEAEGFEARPVALGERSGGKVVIRSGVKPGEVVATEGVYALKARLLKSQIGTGHAH